MARAKGDTNTLDLLEWQPPDIVRHYDVERVKTATLRSKIARGVSETLKECGHSRDVIAALMAEWLGEEMTKNMLGAYASEAREDHTIPYLRLLALVHVTGDARLLQLGAEMFGLAVIETRYLAAVREAMWAAEEERARERKLAERRQWKGGGR